MRNCFRNKNFVIPSLLLAVLVISAPSSSTAFFGKKELTQADKDAQTIRSKVLYAEIEKGEGNTAQQFKELLKIAKNGDKGAQSAVAECYYKGKGVKQNFRDAEKWWEKSANQDHVPAQRRLAIYYIDNIDRVRNADEKALTWLNKAGDQGDGDSQWLLGTVYLEGKITEKNPALAFEWFQKSAMQGNSNGMYLTGLFYSNGYGVKRDNKQAFQWMKRAVMEGEPEALYEIAKFYRDGIGVQRNLRTAVSYCQKASEKGVEGAGQLLANLNSALAIQLNDEALTNEESITPYWLTPSFFALVGGGLIIGLFLVRPKVFFRSFLGLFNFMQKVDTLAKDMESRGSTEIPISTVINTFSSKSPAPQPSQSKQPPPSRTNQPNPPKPTQSREPSPIYQCEYCGTERSDLRSLVGDKCQNHPNGSFKGNHQLFEGGIKERYQCEYCGSEGDSIRSLVAHKCRNHPNGSFKGKHRPYRGDIKRNYACRYCGTGGSSIRSLVAHKCHHHPSGSFKGKHAPAF